MYNHFNIPSTDPGPVHCNSSSLPLTRETTVILFSRPKQCEKSVTCHFVQQAVRHTSKITAIIVQIGAKIWKMPTYGCGFRQSSRVH